MKKGCLFLSLAILTVVFFAFNVIKNIQYPLIWNDESETVMFAKRILQFSYPKVHDGKNTINFAEIPNKNLLVNEKYDAILHPGWGQFYFATLGVFLSEKVDDIYTKTALLRLPFALAGMAGIFIMFMALSKYFDKSKTKKLLLFNLFILLEATSIPLLLHLRQARYYPLAIFLSSSIFYVHFNYKLGKFKKYYLYLILNSILLILLLNTFLPIYMAFIITFWIESIYEFYKKRNLSLLVVPFIYSFLAVPFLVFFRSLLIIQQISSSYNFSPIEYMSNLIVIINFFSKYEFLGIMLILKLLVFRIQPKKSNLNYISNFLSIFFVINIFLAANTPLLYERYFINLEPVLISIIILDIYVLIKERINYSTVNILLIVCSGIILFSNILIRVTTNISYGYELFHHYKGPLDYAIPYILNNYKNPEKLTIATNYEEGSLMYYLGSKVIIGYVGNNLSEDQSSNPDIIIYRKSYRNFQEIFQNFFSKQNYKKIVFPVYDNPVNNIPEIESLHNLDHLFKTKLPKSPGESFDIFLR